MDDKRKNEIAEKKENGILYEPPEPLFPEYIPRRRRLLSRLAALMFIAAVAAAVLAVTAFRDNDRIFGTDEGSNEVSNNESEYGGDSEETQAGTEGEISEDTFYQSESSTEESDGNEVSDSEEASEDKTEEEIECDTETLTAVRESDLSQIEKGENYILNYTNKSPDIAGLIDRGFVHSEKSGNQAPIVMVIHTHTSEKYYGGKAFFDGVCAVGDVLIQRMNMLGLTALHCTVIHDEDENNAYLNARETILTMLEIYPSIKYVIDLHRLELESEGEIVKTYSGCEDGSAQIRLTVSAESGEGWQEDLSLALALRRELNDSGERICMPTVLSQSTYNSDMSKFYIMADIGSAGNTVGEAKAAAKRFAEALCEVILEKSR